MWYTKFEKEIISTYKNAKHICSMSFDAIFKMSTLNSKNTKICMSVIVEILGNRSNLYENVQTLPIVSESVSI